MSKFFHSAGTNYRDNFFKQQLMVINELNIPITVSIGDWVKSIEPMERVIVPHSVAKELSEAAA